MSRKTKIFALIVLGLAAVIFAISSFSGKEEDTSVNPNNLLISNTGVIPLPGNDNPIINSNDEFSKVLSTIKNIVIDTSVLQNPAYILLRDFPVSLGTDSVGRSNPFAPIGVDSPVSTQETLVQTLQAGKITKTTAEAGAQVSLSSSAPVSVVFEYGTTDTFGSVTPATIVTKNTTVLSTLTGLIPETLYYVRAVAIVGSSTTVANTTSFVTSK
ncbi:hypothetical protein IT402_02850 [Candidatus Nomurabacteria bacterium]|nr:hypothetical protein [Candidatus Nomurabacteria bacterium]